MKPNKSFRYTRFILCVDTDSIPSSLFQNSYPRPWDEFPTRREQLQRSGFHSACRDPGTEPLSPTKLVSFQRGSKLVGSTAGFREGRRTLIVCSTILNSVVAQQKETVEDGTVDRILSLIIFVCDHLQPGVPMDTVDIESLVHLEQSYAVTG